MIHINTPFPPIKGNPTTNYAILPSDEVREELAMKCPKDNETWPTHEAYIGEYKTNL